MGCRLVRHHTIIERASWLTTNGLEVVARCGRQKSKRTAIQDRPRTFILCAAFWHKPVSVRLWQDGAPLLIVNRSSIATPTQTTRSITASQGRRAVLLAAATLGGISPHFMICPSYSFSPWFLSIFATFQRASLPPPPRSSPPMSVYSTPPFLSPCLLLRQTPKQQNAVCIWRACVGCASLLETCVFAPRLPFVPPHAPTNTSWQPSEGELVWPLNAIYQHC